MTLRMGWDGFPEIVTVDDDDHEGDDPPAHVGAGVAGVGVGTGTGKGNAGGETKGAGEKVRLRMGWDGFPEIVTIDDDDHEDDDPAAHVGAGGSGVGVDSGIRKGDPDVDVDVDQDGDDRRGLPWAMRYQPRRCKDLCIFPKKLGQLRDWISRYSREVFFIYGPTGCAKRTTIRLCCEEAGLEVRWLTEMEEWKEYVSWRRSPDSVCGRKLMVVVDVQGGVKDMEELVKDVRKRMRGAGGGGRPGEIKGHERPAFPTVVLMTLPKGHHIDWLQKHNGIAFIPISKSAMKKALERICMLEKRARKALIGPVIERACGDVRFAVEMLHFYSIGVDEGEGSREEGGEGNQSKRFKLCRDHDGFERDELSGIKERVEGVEMDLASRDENISLFHALGRAFQTRDLTSLLRSLPVDPSTFVLHFHHHLPTVLPSLGVIADTLDALSTHDALFNDWDTKDDTDMAWKAISTARMCRDPLTGTQSAFAKSSYSTWFRVASQLNEHPRYDPLTMGACRYCNEDLDGVRGGTSLSSRPSSANTDATASTTTRKADYTGSLDTYRRWTPDDICLLRKIAPQAEPSRPCRVYHLKPELYAHIQHYHHPTPADDAEDDHQSMYDHIFCCPPDTVGPVIDPLEDVESDDGGWGLTTPNPTNSSR